LAIYARSAAVGYLSPLRLSQGGSSLRTMSISGEWVPVGPAAIARLGEVLDGIRGSDALAPVRVVVATNAAGVTLRRALARRPGGLANVSFTTIDRLAYDMAASELEGRDRRPVNDQVRAAAVRVALRSHTGPLARVARHPATDRAVADAWSEIRRADAADRLRPGARPVVAAVLEVGDAAAALISDTFDDVDVAIAAADRPGNHPTVVFMPEWLYPAQRRLVAALGATARVRVLFGTTAVEAADRSSAELATLMAVDPAPTATPPDSPPAPKAVVLPDQDHEAGHAARWVLGQIAAGVAPHRIAVLYSAADPYRRSLDRSLERAAVQSNGPGLVSVGATIAGRTLRSLLTLTDGGFRRDDVIAFVSDAPLRSPSGVDIRPTLWDTTTRRAGVVSGVDQWVERLERLIDELSQRADDSPRAARTAQTGRDVVAFIGRLAEDLDRSDLSTWADHVRWIVGLLTQYLPSAGGRAQWPEFEQEAAERLLLTIELLAGLDSVEPDPSWASFLAALSVELDRPTRRAGRLGEGVFVGPLSAAAALDVDAVAIVGASEGLAPRPVRSGVLLGSRELDQIGADLGRQSVDIQHRQWLTSLAAAPERLLVTRARGDLRSGRGMFPSRWLSDDDHSEVDSFTHGLSADDAPLDAAEYRLRRLAPLGDVEAARSPWLAADAAVRRSAEVVRHRRWGSFGQYSGLVEAVDADALLANEVSITAFETFASCPFEYFLGHALRVRALDKPEQVVDIDPRDRGTAIHRVLEVLILERIEAGEVDEARERDRLEQISTEVLDEFEQGGRAGLPLHWQLARERIVRQLREFLILDGEIRAEGASAVSAELNFGREVDPVVVDLPTRSLRFRGSADRVDRRDDGSLVVIDYKSTNRAGGKVKSIVDHVAAGLKLQLPLYARAAAQTHGSSEVRAEYWYLAAKDPSARAGINLVDVEERFVEALDVYVDTIEQGAFPAVPGASRAKWYPGSRRATTSWPSSHPAR
jgi:ATP-dependent helicase/nuclease subunit B